MSAFGPNPLNWWRDVRAWAERPLAGSADKIAAGAASGAAEAQARAAATADAPVIWLLGKVQSGKSSIVQRLTGATAAEIGEGFRPMTRTAAVFDFPAQAPLLRFLDTRGLGEQGYDPAEDIAAAEAKAQLLIVVMRAGDPSQRPVIEALKAIRRRHPDWPVIVAQTWLHAYYPHPPVHKLPYPFTGGPLDADLPGVPADLSRVLIHQRGLFRDLPGAAPLFVPIDFTPADDGLPPADYGLEALLAAIEAAAPAAVQARLAALRAVESDRIGAAAHALILGYAFGAAAADVVPAVGLVAVPGIQGAMLHALAERFDIDWRRRDIMAFLGSLGTGVLFRYGIGFGLRQLAKLVPVYGQTAGAAGAAVASFAFTYALGQAAREYLAARRAGAQPSDKQVMEAYSQGLRDAFRIFRARPEGGK